MEYKTSLQVHANKRAKERLGRDWNRHYSRIVIDLIKGNYVGEAWFVGQKRYWYYISCMGMWVLYDKKFNRIVTVLRYWEIPKPVLMKIKYEMGVRV